MKKALNHRIELFGRAVPTLVIAGLILAGTGTAATLTIFGETGTTSQVDQAIVLNDNAANDGNADGVTTSYEIGNSPAAAGEVYVSNNELANNGDSPYEVTVATSQSNPSVASSDTGFTDRSQDALRTNYVFVDDLLAETEYDTRKANLEKNGDMNSEFVYDEQADQVAVRAYGQTPYGSGASPQDAAGYAGLQVEVDSTTLDGSNTVTVDYRVGENDARGSGTPPDWLKYVVDLDGSVDIDGDGTAEEGTWVLYDITVSEPSGTAVSIDGSDSFADGDLGAFKLENPDNEVAPGDVDVSAVKGNAEIEAVRVVTGSGADDDHYMDVYYHGVSFNGEQRLDSALQQDAENRDFDHTVEPGTDDFAIVNDFRATAYPGQYEVTTEILP